MGIIGIGGVAIINNGSANTNPSGDNTPVYFANCATPSALPTCTYNNGTSGVGATLTANANGALTTTYTDAVALSVGLIILVWKQSSALQNGIYEVTQIGTVSTPWILTRLAIYDTTSEVYPSQVNILGGNTYANLYFLQQTASPTIGTSSIVYQTATAPTGTTINQNLKLVDTYTSSALPTCTYTPNASATTPALNAYLNATSNGVFPTLNGVVPFQYMKVLVYGQADQTQNGDYILQNVGSASSTWRLSRISYTASALYPAWWGIYSGTGRGLIFEQTTSTLTTATIGVSGNIVFVQVSSSGLTYFTEAQNSSSPNATVYVDSLTAVSASTNADISIVPKGAGAFQLAIPDGLVAGGNKRGTNAIDLQTKRSGIAQVASGDRSIILGGSDNTANGAVSVALGGSNIASGTYGNAFGYQCTASGNFTFAMGNTSVANATGAFALGTSNTASGQYSFVGGGLNNTASGLYSVAFGNLCSSIGAASLTFGQSNTANGVFNVCLGSLNTTGNTGSFAIGQSNFSSGGNYSGAMGYLCQATQESAFAIGQSNYSYGRSSFTANQNNTADGDYSVTIGFGGSSLSLKNKFSLGGGAFGLRGDSQIGILPLRSRTTDATASILTTDYSSPSTTNQLILQNNQLITFKGQIQGKKTGTTEVGVWYIDGIIVRGANAGTTTLTISNVNVVTNASGWGTPTLTADTTNGGLKVTVIGLSATNIQWGCRIDTVETIY